jgi:hypothetical protein
MSGPTFKRQQRATGLARIASPYANVTIRISGDEVGYISSPSRLGHDDWIIYIRIKNEGARFDGNPNCHWRHVALTQRFGTEQNARDFVKKRWVEIEAAFDLSPAPKQEASQ